MNTIRGEIRINISGWVERDPETKRWLPAPNGPDPIIFNEDLPSLVDDGDYRHSTNYEEELFTDPTHGSILTNAPWISVDFCITGISINDVNSDLEIDPETECVIPQETDKQDLE